MIISIENRYIFISAPKTGSQSIRDYLLSVDGTACWNTFYLDGIRYQVEEHITAQGMLDLIREFFFDFRIIAFIRDPYAKAVSGYFFYKNGMALHPKRQRVLITKINILFAQILPFQIWALIKPLKTNKAYLTNRKGEVIVNYIGRTEHLIDDFSRICKKLSLPFDGKKISIKNKSRYSMELNYFANPVFKWLFDIKQKNDLNFYITISQKLLT